MTSLPRIWALAFLLGAAVACSAHVEGGGSGGGAAGSGTGGGGTGCPPATPGQCIPGMCVDGEQKTGEASCEDGAWVCLEAPCTSCSPIEVCINGQITTSCCPNGAPCAAAPYCDLGGGACLEGYTCDQIDAGAPCTLGSVSASEFDQSCASDADCTGVFEGSLCSECFCPNAAINQKASAAYQGAIAAAGNSHACPCPFAPPPICSSGTCSMSQ